MADFCVLRRFRIRAVLQADSGGTFILRINALQSGSDHRRKDASPAYPSLSPSNIRDHGHYGRDSTGRIRAGTTSRASFALDSSNPRNSSSKDGITWGSGAGLAPPDVEDVPSLLVGRFQQSLRRAPLDHSGRIQMLTLSLPRLASISLDEADRPEAPHSNSHYLCLFA